MTSLIFDVIGSLYSKDNQNLFVANRYSSISYIKDKNIATRADVTTLTLAKKRCGWECNKTISSKNFCVFTFVKTSGYRFQIESNSHLSDDNCWKTLTSILRQNEQHEQIEIMANHGSFCKRIKMIKKISSNQSCGRDRECKTVRFKVPQYIFAMFVSCIYMVTCMFMIW